MVIVMGLDRRPPGKTIAEICDLVAHHAYRVTRRTVERDLRDLSLILPIAVSDGAVGRWYYASRPNLPGFGLASATEMFAGEADSEEIAARIKAQLGLAA